MRTPHSHDFWKTEGPCYEHKISLNAVARYNHFPGVILHWTFRPFFTNKRYILWKWEICDIFIMINDERDSPSFVSSLWLASVSSSRNDAWASDGAGGGSSPLPIPLTSSHSSLEHKRHIQSRGGKQSNKNVSVIQMHEILENNGLLPDSIKNIKTNR